MPIDTEREIDREIDRGIQRERDSAKNLDPNV